MPASRSSIAVPAWLPPPRGQRYGLALGCTMPLVRGGGFNQLDSALWLPTHRHAAWELHVVLRGRLSLELECGAPGALPTVLDVPGGWCCLTPPGRVHRGRDGMMPPAHLVWMQLAPEHAAATRGTPFTADELASWRARLPLFADRRWPANPAVLAACGQLGQALAATRGQPADAGVRVALAALLLALFHEEPPAALPVALQRALQALGADLRRPRTVAAAARAAGLSVAAFHAACRRHLGTTPATWLLERRLDLARSQLVAGASVAAVAEKLGFSSPRYFAHAFRREVGIPPSGYADLVKAARDEPPLAW